jgi:hypothetical protein
VARVNPLQPAFNAGEIGPRMAARVDFAKYAAAAAVCENMIALPQGGIMRRPGTRFVAETRDSTVRARLLRFEFSTEQAYVIEAGDLNVRFYRDQGRIEVGPTGATIANGGFDAGIGDWDDRSGAGSNLSHDGTNGRLSLVSNGTNFAHAEQDVATTDAGQEHVLAFRVIGAAGDALLVRIGTSSTGAEVVADTAFAAGWHLVAFTPPSSPFYVQFLHKSAKTIQLDDVAILDDVPLELATPYAASDLGRIQTAQSADVMYVCHAGHPVAKLARFGHTAWSLVEVAFDDGPWQDENLDAAKTLAASATTGLGVTLTAAGHSPFAATDVGRSVRLAHGASEPGWGVIVEVTSPTSAKIDVRRAFASVSATSAWRLGAWSATTGYPEAVAFFEQRACFAKTASQPQTLWMSQSADLENMRPDSREGTENLVQDDDALDFTMAAERVDVIQWLSPGQSLAIGTSGGEWVARSEGPVVTPTDIDVKRQTTHGSASLPGIRVGHAALFLQRASRKIREFTFNFEVDGFLAPDLTILSDHITRPGIVEWAYQEEPDAILWCARADGQIACMTYRRDQDVVGWSRQILGGGFEGGHAMVESVAVIPGRDGPGQVFDSSDRDEVWLSVKRTIGGIARRYIEVLERAFAGPSSDDYADTADWEQAVLAAQHDAFYVDCGLTYDGAPTATIAGLGHIEGETVKILADGAVHPDRTVAGGAVTLEVAASKVQVGLGYAHMFKSLKLDVGARAGTAVGKTKRIRGVTLVLLDSMNTRIGPDRAHLAPLEFREVGDAMDTAVPLFTGEKFVELEGDYLSDARFVIRDDAPGPFVLLAAAPELATYEMA